MLPWSLKIMHWSPKIPQLPESIFSLLPKSLKLVQLLPNLQKYKPILPKMHFLSIVTVDAGPDQTHEEKMRVTPPPPSPGTCNPYYVTSIRFYKGAQSMRLFHLAGWLIDWLRSKQTDSYILVHTSLKAMVSFRRRGGGWYSNIIIYK